MRKVLYRTPVALISSANFMNVLSAVNGTAAAATGTGNTGSTGSTGTTSTGTTGTGSATVNPGGFGNNPDSLSGQTPGIGRYYFDGNGSILGLSPGSNGANMVIGSYSVNNNCSATMKLNSGQTFDAVVAQNGSRVLFIRISDSSANGVTGEFSRRKDRASAWGALR